MSKVTLNPEDFNTLVLCSFRYALGRRTYISHTISMFIIRYKDNITEHVKQSIIKDIEHAIEHNIAGDRCDVVEWRKLLTELNHD